MQPLVAPAMTVLLMLRWRLDAVDDILRRTRRSNWDWAAWTSAFRRDCMVLSPHHRTRLLDPLDTERDSNMERLEIGACIYSASTRLGFLTYRSLQH